jgi:hypothetical protein
MHLHEPGQLGTGTDCGMIDRVSIHGRGRGFSLPQRLNISLFVFQCRYFKVFVTHIGNNLTYMLPFKTFKIDYSVFYRQN